MSAETRKAIWMSGALSALAALLVLGGAELHYRTPENALENLNRWTQPYLMTGDFRGLSNESQSPEAFGYQSRGLLYIYSPTSVLTGMKDRGEYLFAGQDNSFRAKPGRKRIFVLGGSVAVGDGVKNPDDRWWKILENELRKRLSNPKIDIVNGASRAFVSSQERVELELYVWPLKPDAVIILDGYNDANSVAFGARPGDPFDEALAYSLPDALLLDTWRWAASFSALARQHLRDYFFSKVYAEKANVHASPEHLDQYAQSVFNVYNENIRTIAQRCEQQKVSCSIFTQPARAFASDARADEEDEVVPGVYKTLLAKLFNGDHKIKLSAYATLYDLSQLVREKSAFVDPVHMNEAGQSRLATAVADALAPH